MPYASCSFSCQPAPSPRRSRPPEMMSTCAAIFATTAGWRYVFPSTMVPTRMRGTRAASALRVLHDSSMAPSRSFVLGMKWSVTQPMSHPVASMCRQRSSTPDQVWAPMLVNRPKRMSLSSSRVSRGGAARAPGAIVRRAGASAKTRATALGSRPDLVGVLGTSSGAHQAILVGMRPHDRRYAAIPLPAGLPAADASVRCAVLCWPVIDPLARYHYVKKLKAGGPPYPEVVDRVLPCNGRACDSTPATPEGSTLPAP